jgi:two-component sensor histidine kinase
MDTAMPCGLLITEIVSNSLKYAFPDNRAGDIFIRIKKEEDKESSVMASEGKQPINSEAIASALSRNDESRKGKISIEISDNGKGMPADVNIENSQSLGLQLINALSNQLDGKLEMWNDNGTHYSVTFTYPKG